MAAVGKLDERADDVSQAAKLTTLATGDDGILGKPSEGASPVSGQILEGVS